MKVYIELSGVILLLFAYLGIQELESINRHVERLRLEQDRLVSAADRIDKNFSCTNDILKQGFTVGEEQG